MSKKLTIRQDGAHNYSILDNENQICVGQTGSELWANIFAAAPETKAQRDELLKACKWALNELSEISLQSDYQNKIGFKLAAAIRKAEGRE